MSKRQSGMSLAEVLVGLAIVSVMIFTSVSLTQSAHQMTRLNNDKEFATQKAISMLEEMKALVQSDTGNDISVLDTYDDGINTNPILTIQGTHLPQGSTKTATLAGDAISGNQQLGPTLWAFERRISVQLVPNQANDVRLVNVKMFKNTPGGQIQMSEVSSVIRTLATTMPQSEVFDVYCLAVENVPGWWVYMSNIVPFVKSAISDLQARNSGLVFRTHWINTLSYGRNLEYTPFINDDNDSQQDIKSVYFYPGKMPASIPGCTDANGVSVDCVGNNYYYPPFFFRGHVMIDTTDTNGYDATNNPYPYALADQYNNSMRYYDELALYQQRKTANPNEEMTWRLLLDDMNMNPQNYTNALLINLHGELLPLPPTRNYSDAAKNPEQTSGPDLRNIRAVTHPEQLRYTNTDAVNLRVYSYLADPTAATSINPVPIKILIHGIKSHTFLASEIQAIAGGVDANSNGSILDDHYVQSNASPCPSAQKQMCFTVGIAGSDAIITLYNSPLKSPWDASNGGGMPPWDRLYGLEYVPSPVEDLANGIGGAAFSNNLATLGKNSKNTARWIITIPATAFNNNSVVTVETRLDDQLTSGVLNPTRDHPENLSRTYFWRGDDNYIFGTTTTAAALPMSERYQMLGDPRHCPYADLKQSHVQNAKLGMGYNPYFDDFEEGTTNQAAAELFNTVPDASGTTYLIPKATNSSNPAKLTMSINGGTAFSVTFNTSTSNTKTMSAATVCSTLNGNSTFSGVAQCDVASPTANGFGYVRINSLVAGASSSVQITGGNPTNSGNSILDNLGYVAGVSSNRAAWGGWLYSTGGNTYGIKNNGTAGDDGWNGNGYLEFDVHRGYQTLRTALLRSNAIWTTMTGFSYYYIGIGNEIGYDQANGFQNAVPVSKMPFTGVTGWGYEDTIIGGTTISGSGTSSAVRVVKDITGSWWGISWLGELHPDSNYTTTWQTSGNLPTNGTSAGHYIRTNRANFPTSFNGWTFSGTDLIDTLRRTGPKGCTTLFWGSSASPADTTKTFHHESSSTSTSSIQTAGTDIANNYSFPVPTSISSQRPFDINVSDTSSNPDNFLEPGVYPSANLIKVLNQYYKNTVSTTPATNQGSALVTVSDPTTFDTAFVAVNGLSPTGVSGTTFIAKWAFLSLIHSFLSGGLYTDSSSNSTGHHVRQVPRVSITSPNATTNTKAPSSLSIAWSLAWQRWDGNTYTTSYPASYTLDQSLTMKYAILYSTSNGLADKSKNILTGWYYATDDTAATPGVKPDSAHETTGTSYTWNTPSTKFPEGTYLIRVEAYREGYPLHYSFHQYRVYIKR